MVNLVGAHVGVNLVDVSFVARGDATQSGDAHDDMSDTCIEDGWNLEFHLLRREGVPAPPGNGGNRELSARRVPHARLPQPRRVNS